MSGIKYLLDTNIIIGMYQQNSRVVELFKNKKATIDECAFSSVTRMELLGFPSITETEKKAISTLLKLMTHCRIDEAVEESTIIIKQQCRIKLPDAIIAATALCHQLELLSLDKKLVNKFNQFS